MPVTPADQPAEYGIPAFEHFSPPWMTTDCDPPLDLFPEGIYSPSYDAYAMQQGSSAAPSSYLALETLDSSGSWARNDSVSTANTSIGSPTTEFSYLGADTDTNRVPTLVSSLSKLMPTAQADRKRSISEAKGPSKRSCSQTVGAGTIAATAGPVTRSKESWPSATSKPTKSKAGGKSKDSKRSSGKSQSSSSSTSSSRSGKGGSHKAQLRTASRKPKQEAKNNGSSPSAEDRDEDDLLTPDERRARHSHNLVEKQYRNRLNRQFESLLAVLPAEGDNCPPGGTEAKPREGKGSVAGIEGDDRRLSKAEVLDMARHRIMALESECDRLQNERRGLTALAA